MLLVGEHREVSIEAVVAQSFRGFSRRESAADDHEAARAGHDGCSDLSMDSSLRVRAQLKSSRKASALRTAWPPRSLLKYIHTSVPPRSHSAIRSAQRRRSWSEYEPA